MLRLFDKEFATTPCFVEKSFKSTIRSSAFDLLIKSELLFSVLCALGCALLPWRNS